MSIFLFSVVAGCQFRGVSLNVLEMGAEIVKSSTQPGVKPIRRRLEVKARRSGAEYGVTDAEGVVGSSGARRGAQPSRWFHRLQSCLTLEFGMSARR